MMGLFEHWPYVNFHDLNLDWIIGKIKNVETAEANSHASAEASAESAAASQLSADASQASADASQHSADDSQHSANDSQQSAEASAASELSAKNYADHIADPVSGLVTEWLRDNITPTTPAVDASLAVSGAAADAKVTGDKINELTNTIDSLPYYTYRADEAIDGKYLDADGNEQTASGWSITPYLRIKNIALYDIRTGVTSNNVRSCLYDKNKNFISSFRTYYDGLHPIFATSDAYFVRFSILTSEKTDFKYSEKILIDTSENGITAPMIEGNSLVKSYADEMISGQYYTETGAIASSTSWKRSKQYPVNSGDIVTIKNAFGVYAVLFDETMTFLSAKQINVLSEQAFIIPEGASYLAINYTVSNESGYTCLINGHPLGAVYRLDWIPSSESIWTGKTYISHGDSITWQDGKAYTQGEHIGEIAKGYQTIFNDAVDLQSYVNMGVSGWSMAVVNGNGIVNTVLGVASYSVYDLCTIACGTNDFKLNVPLGNLGQIGDTTFDDTTFYGAFRKAVEYILSSNPNIRMVLMTPLQRNNAGYDVNYTNSAGHKLVDYVNAIKELGEMYGLPVCDMYGNSGFTQKTLSTYTMDGLHPNDIGYQRMGSYLTGFLNAVGN